ncbi:helix-turn-helix domain-containing protein [Streptomyces sp. ACA25]|uniref:helix-turn-helix domain-containing protein n=1 Tax=Streptomyces sp. ACA25 TaxID=3022596 RepID=UPI0023076482|nr:helix-turn-helix domain-containing protein [Streptomyces sp. ACA25]MDB1087243.1 helix-turn-helix domain-containing protein [Streptomyces sp. ACA25]
MSASTARPTPPPGANADFAARALAPVKKSLARSSDAERIHVRIEEGDADLELPREAVELLATVLSHMAAGRAVSIVPEHAELTTQQAADMLNVSRPFLIGLLEAGEIDYRKVGTHRRIKAQSLLEYQRHDDRKRREAADELTAVNQEMGLI